MTDVAAPVVTGRIFEIQRFSIHDGPGIRTTVFLQGCPLRCRWCHNPEGTSTSPLLSFIERKCVRCGACFEVCPHCGHEMVDDRHVLRRGECDVCGRCAEQCHSGALQVIGREVAASEVLATVLRDRPFYDTSGGGMTLSGGEPLAQIDFAVALLRGARESGIHCCVETCGFAPFECLERIVPYVDLFLYDVKDTDDVQHREHTGVSNRLILENLGALHGMGAAIRIRLPMVPGYNDRPDFFAGIGRMAKEMPGLEGVEIMPYHRLGSDKRIRLGLEDDLSSPITPPGPDEIGRWTRQLTELGVRVVA